MRWWNRETTEESPSASVGAATDVGRVRTENEDAYGHRSVDGDRLFVVADGMGGHTRGQEASTTAVEVVQNAYAAAGDAPVMDRLREALHRANRRVYALAQEGEGPGSMGTTVTALVLARGRSYIAHVGDSRAYHLTDEACRQLTQDHTMAASMHREGLITEEEVRTHPRRGTLTRAIGTEPTVQVDVIDLGPIAAGDRFLLCTDGLADLPPSIVTDLVRGHPPQDACEQLVQQANDRGGYDNATALVVHVRTAS